jgi:hypothetical protein
MLPRLSPASDTPTRPPDPPDPGSCPTPEGLKARLGRLRGRSLGVRTLTGRDRGRDFTPTPPRPDGPDRPAVPPRTVPSIDPPSSLDELVALLAAGLPPIDVETEILLSPGEVTELLPPRRRGRKAHKSTIFRWMKTGYKGLRLPFIQVGHQRCTSINALQTFLSALTAIARFEQGDPAPPHPGPSPETQLDRSTVGADRHRGIEEELLRRYGI